MRVDSELRNETHDLIDRVERAQHLIREPGNGTRYDVFGFRVSGRLFTGGRLGSITDGWLITLGTTARSYLFGDGDIIAPWYVEEKLGVRAGDSTEVARIIAELIGGTVA